MKPHSLQRRMIFIIVFFEIASLFTFGLLAIFHESETRLQAFDQMLRSDAALLFGGVEDADDVGDNIMLEMKGLRFPSRNLFDVTDQKGRILGSSRRTLPESVLRALPVAMADGLYSLRVDGRRYRFVVMHAVRVIDPGMANGGSPRAVVIRYGAPVADVWHQIFKTIAFYCVASLFLVSATVVSLVLLLRKGFAPLSALAAEASRLNSQQWTFAAPPEAASLRELAPLTQALEATVARLQRSFEQQRRLTSDAAHELKTAVAIVKSSLQVVNIRERTPADYRGFVDNSINDVLRLEEIVARMLMLARLDHVAANGSKQTHTFCEAASVLRRVSSQLDSYATLKKITIDICTPSTQVASISEDDLSIVCTNLLLNALQHGYSGSTVYVSLHDTDQGAELTIRDDGEGISGDKLPHIFEPFYRGESARDRKSGGTGLGLSICKGIVEAAGGSILVTSQSGLGTQVAVMLRGNRLPASIPSFSQS